MEDQRVEKQLLQDQRREEQRRFVRTPSGALVEMHHPSFGTIQIKARDLSDGGIFALMGNHKAPPVGTTVMVRIKRYTGVLNEDPVPMCVVHQQQGGIGLAFVR
jgi:c-di-GMP-binding flagellar brake protein YcgR